MKRLVAVISVVLVSLGFLEMAQAQQGSSAAIVNKGTMSSSQRVASAAADNAMPAEVGPSMSITIGKSVLMRLPSPIERISVGNPAVADVTLISSRELYLLGKTFGSTNVILWRKGGPRPSSTSGSAWIRSPWQIVYVSCCPPKTVSPSIPLPTQ